jgi:peroxiredoxin
LIVVVGYIFFTAKPVTERTEVENIFANLSSKPQNGSLVPDFSLADLKGNEIRISQFRGKPVILNFWSIDCAPCKKEMPIFQKLVEKTKDEIDVVAVNMGDSRKNVESFVNANGITFTILLDEDGRVADLFKVVAFPVTYIIDQDGIIQNHHTGQLTDDLLKTYLSTIGINS